MDRNYFMPIFKEIYNTVLTNEGSDFVFDGWCLLFGNLLEVVDEQVLRVFGTEVATVNQLQSSWEFKITNVGAFLELVENLIRDNPLD